MWFSSTVNWLTTSQSLRAGLSKSNRETTLPETRPFSVTSTVTPLTRARWNSRLVETSAEEEGRRAILRYASSRAEAGSPGLRRSRAACRRAGRSTCSKDSRSAFGVSGSISCPLRYVYPRAVNQPMAACSMSDSVKVGIGQWFSKRNFFVFIRVIIKF